MDTTSQRRNDTARIVSPVFAATSSDTCQLRFWFHLYGYNVAGLNVYIRNFIGGPMKRVWSQTGSKGDDWFRARVDLQSQQPFQVLIEGVSGPGYAGMY